MGVVDYYSYRDHAMTLESITILGGGNTAFALAANLALRGSKITLCELPSFAHMVEPIQASRTIELDGVAQRGTAQLAAVTTDFARGLAAADVAILAIPAYGHRAFAEACAPHLRPGQVIVLTPGTLGSLEFVEVLKRHKKLDNIILAETDTAPYVCRRVAPTAAHIWGVVSGLGLGVWPASESERVRSRLEPLFPGVRLYPHVLACGLSSMNPVVHPAGILMNAGRIERSRGEFYFYDEGVTPSVCRVIEAVDGERLAVGAALGCKLADVATAFYEAGFGPRGDLWAAINGSRMLTALKAPGKLDMRWLTEDAPYGLASWAMLGEQLGSPCATMRSLVDLTGAMLGVDFWKSARRPEQLGLAGLDRPGMLARMERG
jgi:opine dehydrogenase